MLYLLLMALLAHAEGVPVSPDTPSTPIAPPPEPPKLPKAPPECVSKALETIFEAEKINFAEKKVYSSSLFDLHIAAKIGLGCPGWDLPEIKNTYGGTGFTATMNEQSTKMKWTINQDKAVFLDTSEAGPVKAFVKEKVEPRKK